MLGRLASQTCWKVRWAQRCLESTLRALPFRRPPQPASSQRAAHAGQMQIPRMPAMPRRLSGLLSAHHQAGS